MREREGLSVEDVRQLSEQLEVIRRKVLIDIDDLTSTYAAYDPSLDIRVTCMSRLLGILTSTYLALTFVHRSLLRPAWWRAFAKHASRADIETTVDGFSDFSKIAFVHQIFSCTESAFRVFLRAIDSTACNNGTAQFKSIYECLLRSKLSAYPPESIELLDLLRLIRNTVHNNGVYFHRTRVSEAVVWQGKKYEFRHGLPVDFTKWDFCLEISDEVRKLLGTVANDPNLKAAKKPIMDPFAVHTK